MKENRCLVILDKVEAVLRSGDGKTYEWAGEYKQGYEKYGYLFKKVAEAAHQSCLLLTSREKPKQVALLEGKKLPVKVLHLKGLNIEEAKAMLASGSADSTVKLWNLDTEQCIMTLTDHRDIVWSVAFSSDGKTLASGSEDQTARLWNINTGECLNIFDGHSKQVYSVAFSPDGQIVATGSGDATIKLWSVSTGNFLDHLTSGHTAAIRSVAFSSDGQLLASGGEDESIQLWDIQKCRRLQQLKSDRLYEGMNITGISGLTDAEKASLKALGAVEKGDRLLV